MAVSIDGNATFPVGTPYAGASASPVYSGRFIPTLWSSKLLEKFYDGSVIAAIANTDYEGEIRNKGDKVIIRTIPSLNIFDYEADMALPVQRPSSDVVELPIDQGKGWNAVCDDVFAVQSDLDMLSMWTQDASEQMRIAIDRDVLAQIPVDVAAQTDAATDNMGAAAGRISHSINLGVTGTPVVLTDRTENIAAGEKLITDFITHMGQVLDEQNIPVTGRWLVLPAWASSMIKRSDIREVQISGDKTSIMRNGMIGVIDRFTVYISNLLPNGAAPGPGVAGEFYAYAGHSHGLTFASQITKVETLTAETTFGRLIRGLQVYGRKVVDGKSLAVAVVKQG